MANRKMKRAANAKARKLATVTDYTPANEKARKVAEKDTTQPKTDTTKTGDNNPPPDNVPAMSFKKWLGLEQNEDASTAVAEIAKAQRIRGALLLMWNEPAHMSNWMTHAKPYLHEKGKAHDDALAWFEEDFGLPARATLDGDALKYRDRRRNRMLETVHFCYRVHELKMLSVFKFNEKGICFILSSSTLGREIWKAKGWDQEKNLTDVMNDIQMVDRPTTLKPALSWPELLRMVLPKKGKAAEAAPKTGEPTPLGTGEKTQVTLQLSKPLDMLAATSKAIAAAEEHTLNDRQRFIIETENNVAVMFNNVAYVEMRKAFETFTKLAREALQMKPRGATGSGKPVSAPLNVTNVVPIKKPTMVEPEVTKVLPLAPPKVQARKATMAEVKRVAAKFNRKRA